MHRPPVSHKRKIPCTNIKFPDLAEGKSGPESAATKNKTLNALRIVFQEAKSQGIVSENVAAQLKPFVERPKEQEVLSGEQLKKLFPENRTELIEIWKRK